MSSTRIICIIQLDQTDYRDRGQNVGEFEESKNLWQDVEEGNIKREAGAGEEGGGGQCGGRHVGGPEGQAGYHELPGHHARDWFYVKNALRKSNSKWGELNCDIERNIHNWW